jgi:hypothetical protein
MQSFCAVGLVHEAFWAQLMHLLTHWPPQLCSIDWQPMMQPVSPWQRLLQCWYWLLQFMAHEPACMRHDWEVEHEP